MEKVDLKFIKGDTFLKGFVIENYEPEITQLYFTVKEKTTDKKFVIQKRLNEGIKRDEDNPNRYILTIDPSDTDNLKVKTNYVYDIQLVGDIKRTIIGGYVYLEDWDVTSKVNEV